MEPLRRNWRPGFPLDLGQVLGPLHRGAADPVSARARDRIWRPLV
ncbi:hypothetical protein [Kitasatospora sp. GP82]|nr:hypothetical protein [Kitasatospora sp. GP82]MDH6129939.1 hypothetical protein [Kitasatospora sp. GP82]